MDHLAFLDVVVVELFVVAHVISLMCEYLLIFWYALFVLDIIFDFRDQLLLLDLQGYRLAVYGLDEDLLDAMFWTAGPQSLNRQLWAANRCRGV